MKKLILFLSFTFFFLSLWSQPYLNQREDFGYVNSKITSILPDNDGYYLTGIILDTVLTGGYTWQSFFMKTDFEGDTIFNYKFTSPDVNFELWGESTFFTKDSTIIAYGSWKDTGKHGLITEFSKEGNLLKRKKIFNPIHPEGRSITMDQVIQLPSGNFIFTATPLDSLNRSYISLGKMNADFDILWFKTFGDSKRNNANSLLIDNNYNLIVGGIVFDRSKIWYDFQYQINIIKTDTSGNVYWDFKSKIQDSLAYSFDMVLDKKGDLMIATSKIWEKQDTIIDDIFGTSYLKPAVIKFDTSEKKIIWEKVIQSANWDVERPLKRILPASDSSGFVCAGQIRMNHRDSSNRDIRGLIFKITSEGDTTWVRNYEYLTEGERNHYFNDMEVTPDGGYVAGGISIRTLLLPDESPWLRTWLVKTDEHGCLIPGCEITSATEIKKNELIVNIYPNPASEQINFYLKYHQNLKNVSCRLIDISGKELQRHEHLANDGTYILPIDNLPTGVYFLQIWADGVAVKTEKIIKK